jgi:hypothetical protein
VAGLPSFFLFRHCVLLFFFLHRCVRGYQSDELIWPFIIKKKNYLSLLPLKGSDSKYLHEAVTCESFHLSIVSIVYLFSFFILAVE